MRHTRGFSLLELVVVMAMFAVVALIGLQVIAQTLRNDERLTKASREASDLAYGLALLRADLGAAIALPFHPPNGLPAPPLDAPAREGRFSLSLGGQASLDGDGAGLARVTWRLDPAANTVTRQVWPVLIPGAARLAGPEVTMFEGVRALALEGYVPGQGWGSGFPRPGKDAPPLPAALRVTMEHAAFGRVQTIVTLR